MKNFVFSIFMLLALSACSTIEFNTSGNEKFRVGILSASEKEASVVITKDFYFWGLSPEFAEINFQDETKNLGVNFPSYVTIEQSYTFKDIAYTFLTLGLYCPVTYKLTLLTNGSVK
jgi:uncharacterized protein YceK